MSRLYDTIEPNVINDEMLKKMVEEQGPKEEAGRIAKLEGIDFKDVTSLHLDFKRKRSKVEDERAEGREMFSVGRMGIEFNEGGYFGVCGLCQIRNVWQRGNLGGHREVKEGGFQ
ncbi:hypothetical protein FKM82_002869 [Ascaphus truei]